MKHKLLKLMAQNEGFLKNSSIVVSWTIISQLLMFACIPVVSRLYIPAVFGVYAVFNAIMYTLNQVACLRGELLITLPQKKTDAKNLFAACLFITTVMSLFLLAVTCFFSKIILHALQIEALDGYIWLIAVGVLIVGFRNSLLYWAVRNNLFATVGKANFIQAPVLLFVQIGFGFFFPSALCLVLGAVASWAAALAYLIKKLFNRRFLSTVFARLQNAWLITRANKQFLFHSSLSILMLGIANYMPVILVSSAYDTQVAAWFALAMQAVYSPLDLISVSVSQVYLNKGAKLFNTDPGALSLFYIKTTCSLLLLGLIPMLVIGLFAPLLFQFIFGDNWGQAGVYAQIMSVMFLVRFAIVSSSQNLAILKRQGQALLWSIMLVCLLCLSFLPAYYHFPKPSPETTLILFSILMIIAYVILFLLNLLAAKKYAANQTQPHYLIEKNI
ncbi:lipopolysaccharide biosynthesis protein [Legionella londiniensis]|uniref:Polysaccharide biosynthesis protein n=1 Tax=Legionella londiniensis TaxID=45068 RepID=A0A0W0VPG2_9GAMM|nr:oligosaccharide flippase family protein [Legionella londiniensis]KTD21641.1 hypothetical protein Llon_0806 [Legionella londiniensis]STX93525.1 Uncharacterised protein [Legionella londiniensis]